MQSLIFPPLARLEAYQRQTFSCCSFAHIPSSNLEMQTCTAGPGQQEQKDGLRSRKDEAKAGCGWKIRPVALMSMSFPVAMVDERDQGCCWRVSAIVFKDRF